MGASGTPGNYITFQPYGFTVPASGCGGYSGTPAVVIKSSWITVI